MEHEIKGHVVKAYKTLKNPVLKPWHKVGEIAIEIGIIVFAVTLSIWLHDISEHNHEQKEVKTFMTGLKKDLTNDIVELKQDRDAYVVSGATFSYISTVSPNFKLNMDSIKKYENNLFNTITFLANDGRYQGFKSSGKLGNIENDSLQNDIINLYQHTIPSILSSTNQYILRKQSLFEFFNKNLKRNRDGTGNIIDVLASSEAVNISKSLNYVTEICTGYDNAIAQSKRIIKEIDKEYDL